MPRKGQTTALERPTGVRGSIQEQPIKPPRNKKRVADENVESNAKTRKRAAFGDLTNAVAERRTSLTKQVKKGFSNIVNRTASKNTTTSTSTTSSVNAKKFKLAAASTSSTTSIAEEVETLVTSKAVPKNKKKKSLDLAGSQSLPSSQNEKIVIREDPAEESEYESAEENPSSREASIIVQRYEPPARPVPPPGVEDFDVKNWNDPNQCSQYAMDIFYYYKSREAQFRVPDYISTQTEVSKSMRAILVDWLVEVQESFELNHETLYTAVKILDLYMANKVVNKEELQLVGATACLIACKIDERIPPMLDDFVYVCDDAYSRKQLMDKEREVLKIVGFDVGYPLSYRFVRRYGRVCNSNMNVLTYARYVLEMSLMEYKFNVEISESKLAAAALVLAFKINNVQGWKNTLAFYSGYTISDLKDLVESLLNMLQQYPKDNLKTVRQKYSHKVFHEVALIPLPESIEITEEQ